MTIEAHHDITVEQAGQAFLTGETFTDEAFFHAAATKLRAEAPVHWVEHPDFNPFYVVTKHADVLDIELHPDRVPQRAPGASSATRLPTRTGRCRATS